MLDLQQQGIHAEPHFRHTDVSCTADPDLPLPPQPAIPAVNPPPRLEGVASSGNRADPGPGKA